MSSTDQILKKKAPIEDTDIPLTFRFSKPTSLILNKMFLVDLISKRADPFLNHDSAVRVLLEEHYGKPFEQIIKEFEERQTSKKS